MALINTVLGPVDETELGIVLPCERVVEDHTCDEEGTSGGNAETITDWASREFESLINHSARTLVEVTPPGFGRSLPLLRRLQERTHLRIVASTGFGPPERRPPWAHQRKTRRIAEVLIRELTQGIGESDSRAGVISYLCDRAPEEDESALEAIARAHKETGAPVIVHAAERRAERLNALEGAGVKPRAVALTHAGCNASPRELEDLARRGASLVFVNWGIASRARDEDLVALVKHLHAAGLIGHVMISVDFGFRIRQPDAVEWPLFGVPGRTYAYLFRQVLPMLRGAGFTEGDLWQMMVANPAAFLAAGGIGDEPCRLCGHAH